MRAGGIDQAKNGEPLRSRYNLETGAGLRAAIREIYPPDASAEASFDRLLGELRDEPGCNVPTRFNGGAGHASY